MVLRRALIMGTCHRMPCATMEMRTDNPARDKRECSLGCHEADGTVGRHACMVNLLLIRKLNPGDVRMDADCAFVIAVFLIAFSHLRSNLTRTKAISCAFGRRQDVGALA